MKKTQIYSNVLEFFAYFVSAVALTVLAKKYEPSLVILPLVFLGLYAAKLLVRKFKNQKKVA
jgi:hypothetical protein